MKAKSTYQPIYANDLNFGSLLDTPCTAGARSAIWRVIHLEIRRLTCFKKMRFGISVKVGIWKQKPLFYKKFKKVQKKWSKIGSRKVRIVTLKATFRASFFGTPKNPCFKVPVDSSMRDTSISPSQKSQNFRTDKRTDGRTEIQIEPLRT